MQRIKAGYFPGRRHTDIAGYASLPGKDRDLASTLRAESQHDLVQRAMLS